MKHVLFPVCDGCGEVVYPNSKGVVIQGFALSHKLDASGEANGGLIGTGGDAEKPLKEASKTCWHQHCFEVAVGWAERSLR